MMNRNGYKPTLLDAGGNQPGQAKTTLYDAQGNPIKQEIGVELLVGDIIGRLLKMPDMTAAVAALGKASDDATAQGHAPNEIQALNLRAARAVAKWQAQAKVYGEEGTKLMRKREQAE